ncbi:MULTISPECIES: HlyD family type I secretion periplasmic adaptor subunit [Deefgea]|uniref:Membrane fusion protein (MFP) family protein n=1 Tax=Deefgea chitinilytica TaxID=570276 RepID=A0ABS2CF40_9NEIS|nr:MULTISPECIES: HlyD family type I secretion periplasmic adaptor subunit [Deefgea]MBM5572747.1 HlyD family type I secretion periplasmic adaptor subunit [Deefgea chitinilytica]MBM9889983.1 HlyD family type I secretion periplasmic adaptor subunit [Deefgea sp. CFH1-16]
MRANKKIKREDLHFLGDGAAAIYGESTLLSNAILYASVALILIFIVWAFFAEIDQVTLAEGKVIPSSQVQVIQNLEGGIVAQTPVKVGDIVKKGQVLMKLDEKRFSSSLGESTVKRDALTAKLARLTAESNGSNFEPPVDLLKSNPQVVEAERQLFVSRKRELESNIAILQSEAAQRSHEIEGMRAKIAKLESGLKLANDEYAMSKPLAEKNVISQIDFMHLQRQISDLKGEINEARLSIPRLQSSLAETNGKVAGVYAKARADAGNELSLVKAELDSTEATTVALSDRFERTTIRAPLDGVVKLIKVNTVGGVLQPGMDVMEIVPLEDNLLIEAKVRPSDIGFLRPGQEAMVKFSAYDFSIYGGLVADVETITADSVTDEAKKESFYLVRVRTRSNHLGDDKRPLAIIPGMLATVHIRTGKKTVMQYLMKPIVKARDEAMRER